MSGTRPCCKITASSAIARREPRASFALTVCRFAITNRESAERWQKVLNALNSGAMPPDDEKQPDPRAKADLLEDLAQAMVAARRNLADQRGLITMRRLNRREYRNTLRELLGVEIDVSELPADTGTGGFDTAGANLFMSSDQFEQYLALGREGSTKPSIARPMRGRSRSSDSKRRRSLTGSEATCRTVSSIAGSTCSGQRRSTRRPSDRKTAAAAAAIRAGLTNQPPWNFYHSWQKLKGVPSPQEFGFVDAERATHEGISAWNLLPYQAYFLVQPELKTGAFLTIRDNGVNPIFNFAIGGDWPSGEYIVRIRIAATKHATPARRFVEFGVQATHLSTHEVMGTMDASAGDRRAIYPDEKPRRLVFSPGERDV